MSRGKSGSVGRRAALVVAALALLAGLASTGRVVREAFAPGGEDEAVAAVAVEPRPTPTRAASREPEAIRGVDEPSPGSLAPSLRDTTIDGDFDRGPDGGVVFGPAMVRLFDYLRSTIGEATEDEVRAFLERLARARLRDAEEVERVLFLYDRYVAMLDEAADRIPSERRSGDPEGALELLHAIRVSAFGEEDAARAFGESERTAGALFARARVLADTTSTPDERERRLEAIEASMPEAQAESFRALRVAAELRERTSALREAGADESAVRAMRVSEVGVAAADRLEALDDARAAFRARVDAYRAELEALETASRGEPSEEAIAAVRARHFTGAELLRIAALDRLARASAELSAGSP